MAFGNNRAAARPRVSFQVAGGTVIKFAHPFLAGQISDASPIDEIDVSRALKLNDTFFNATPAQDSSFQEILVDGSVVTITNHLLNGSMTLQVLRTTGLVGTGDLIAALQLIKASKDDVGGTLTVIKFINGKRIVRIYYGVSVKNVPDDILAGNSVPVFPCVLLYAGWVEGVSAASTVNERTIWAVGNKYGLKAAYKPYAITESENSSDFFGGSAYYDNNVDTNTGDIDTPAAGQTEIGALSDSLKGASIIAPVPATGTATSAAQTNPEKWPAAF